METFIITIGTNIYVDAYGAHHHYYNHFFLQEVTSQTQQNQSHGAQTNSFWVKPADL